MTTEQTQEDSATRRDGSAVERGVRPLAGPNMRRMLRAARLCEELGHGGDTLAALEELKRLKAREKACATMDEAQKISLVRALQECCAVLGLHEMASPADLVKAVRGLAA
jgi:hypothetical protein